jgi:hypothetical protein
MGLSNGIPAEGELIGQYPNSFAITVSTDYHLVWCHLAGEAHIFQLPADGAIQPKLRDDGMDVYGCGLVMDPNDKLAIFFTLNGILIGIYFY